jgi:Coenzyme F420-dependent N5,N10-methylene tetrahydromethanopterin reductase and related flavin-dependent oxidoreductases
MLGNIGITLLNTGDLSTQDIIRYAQEAEALGYEGFWICEGDGKEAFSTLSLVAHTTQHLNLGTSIVSFYSRTPTLLAMTAGTLYRMSGGRFKHLGIGTGGVGFTERGHGVKIERPVIRAKETVDIVRGLLMGQSQEYQSEVVGAQAISIAQDNHNNDRFTYNGHLFQLHNFRFREGSINGKLPIYLSAIGPKMVALAARSADGIITNGLTEETYERYMTIIKREAEAVGRDPKEIKLFTLAMMAQEDDMGMDAVRNALAFFFASTHYYPLMEVAGYGQQAIQIQQAWQKGEFARAAHLITNEMVQKFAIMGSPDQRRKKLHWMMDLDVYPIIYPVWRSGYKLEDYFNILQLVAQYLRLDDPSLIRS